jgi:hypothetical protein
MTIHEMLHQTALLARGDYRRSGSLSSIEIHLPNDRRQVIYGTVERIRGENAGLLYSRVGTLTPDIDLRQLLAYNAVLRHARIALMNERDVVLLVMFDPATTSITECAPMLQELAAIADELERVYFNEDRS